MIKSKSEESKTASGAAADSPHKAPRRNAFPSTAFRDPVLRQLASERPPSHTANAFPSTAFRQPILDLLAARGSAQ